jgi:hypothetical protein
MPLKRLFLSNKITDVLGCATKYNYIMKSKKLLSCSAGSVTTFLLSDCNVKYTYHQALLKLY